MRLNTIGRCIVIFFAYFGGAIPGLLIPAIIGISIFIFGLPLLLVSPFTSLASGICSAEPIARMPANRWSDALAIVWGACWLIGGAMLSKNVIWSTISEWSAADSYTREAGVHSSALCIGLWTMHLGAAWNGIRYWEQRGVQAAPGLHYFFGALPGIVLWALFAGAYQWGLSRAR